MYMSVYKKNSDGKDKSKKNSNPPPGKANSRNQENNQYCDPGYLSWFSDLDGPIPDPDPQH
jgi:hypothetical protein